MENIAFYGGSFNPPTNIHLQIAKNVLKQLNIDKVYFVPVGNYYQKNELIDVKHRLNMLNIMCENQDKMYVSDITLNEKNNLKAIDVFKMLKEKYSNDNVYFIMGSDNFIKITEWKNFDELVENYKIIIVKRDNVDINKIILENRILEVNKNNFFIINSEDTQNKVDSTEVRRKIKNSENIDKYLNKKISEYIVQNGLYLDNEDDIIEE